MEKISKKIQILDASEELFFKLGFEGASTRAIAKIAKVNMAMINYYFGSKEGLFASVIIRLLQEFGVQLVDIDRMEISNKEKFYKIIDIYIERIFMRPETFLLIYRELNLVRNEEMVQLISERVYQNYNAMTQLLLHGIEAGEFKPVDVRMVMATVQGVVNHIILSPKKINEMSGLGFDSEPMKLKTIQTTQSHIKSLLDLLLIK